MSDSIEFCPVILYREDAKAVHDALAAAGQNALANKIATGAQRSENDYKLIAALPYLDENEFDTDDVPVVSSSDDGGYVMIWCWVSNEDAGINCEQMFLDEASNFQI